MFFEFKTNLCCVKAKKKKVSSSITVFNLRKLSSQIIFRPPWCELPRTPPTNWNSGLCNVVMLVLITMVNSDVPWRRRFFFTPASSGKHKTFKLTIPPGESPGFRPASCCDTMASMKGEFTCLMLLLRVENSDMLTVTSLSSQSLLLLLCYW